MSKVIQINDEPILKYREVTFLVDGRHRKKKVPLEYLKYEQSKMSALMDNFEKSRMKLEAMRAEIGKRRYEVFKEYQRENKDLVFDIK